MTLIGNWYGGLRLNQGAAVLDTLPHFLIEGLYEHTKPMRVTLPITSDMRETFERMARELQRKRSQKNERITANTVMRVALEFFMNQFSVEKTDRVNTEEELLEAAKKQLGLD